MENTPNLDLPYISPAQAQKHVTHNEAIRMLDALVQLCVRDRHLTEPPESPVEGHRHIIAIGATGEWSARDGQIAAFQDGAWNCYTPGQGWIAWVADEGLLVGWTGTEWVVAGGGGLNPTALVGVNATADLANRLALSSAASLFSHEGAGHQLKINKAAPSDTASLLYQSGFSGRAEMGLAGDDDFHVKVSPDGANWKEAVVVDTSTGQVGVGAENPLARVHCRVEAADLGRAFLMTGKGVSGSDDPEHGAVLVLSHNVSGNRQFFLGNSETGAGVRIIGSALDGYNYLSTERGDLILGSDTTDVRIHRHLMVSGSIQALQWARVGAYAGAALPNAAAAGPGAIIYVGDEAGGATLAFCDGANWRRIADRAVVS